MLREHPVAEEQWGCGTHGELSIEDYLEDEKGFPICILCLLDEMCLEPSVRYLGEDNC